MNQYTCKECRHMVKILRRQRINLCRHYKGIIKLESYIAKKTHKCIDIIEYMNNEYIECNKQCEKQYIDYYKHIYYIEVICNIYSNTIDKFKFLAHQRKRKQYMDEPYMTKSKERVNEWRTEIQQVGRCYLY